MVGATETKSRPAGEWQLGDPRSRRDRPGTIFRIRADRHREVVAQLAEGWQTDGTARGARRVRCDVAAIARCLGVDDLHIARDVLCAAVTVMIDAVAVETAVAELDKAIRAVADRLELDGDDRCFAVQACTLARSARVALPRAAAEALGGEIHRSRHLAFAPIDADQVSLRVALDRPEPLAFAVAEIRRTPAGLSLVPVDEVLRWSWEPRARRGVVAGAAGGEPPELGTPPRGTP